MSGTILQTQSEVVEEIIRASNAGREIICLVGAGFSVGSGIPALAVLTEYLAKVQCYITKGVFSPRASRNDSRWVVGEEYRNDPSLYVRDFGWPDPNQLNADLWRWIDQDLERRSPEARMHFRRFMHYHVQAEVIEDLRRFDPGIHQILPAGLDPEAMLQKESAEAPSLWSFQGNWKSLITHLTHANPDYVDTLFQSLVRNRRPGMAHRFLAFLTPILGLRLFLTVNFDDLLEEALRYEGYHPAVYAVSRESPLPHPSLVRNELSVVKLHGNAFGLRVGESLDYPLDENSKKRLELYLPDDPLLLVMGVGGWDRRVMDFVELVAGKPGRTSVLWMHFESTCPEPVAKLAERLKGKLLPVRTLGPGPLLLDLFGRFTGSHPPSLRPYDAKMSRPIFAARERGTGAGEVKSDKQIQIFEEAKTSEGFGASLALARCVAEKAATHVPIWIDLEAMHTYQDVVVEIFRQVRYHDRSVPPIVLPGGPTPDAGGIVDKAVRRIFEALSRGRYILAFNGVGFFGRPPTFHHGLPSAPNDEETERIRWRDRFLYKLFAATHLPQDWKGEHADPTRGPRLEPLRDSILSYSIDLERCERWEISKEFLELHDRLKKSDLVFVLRVPREDPPEGAIATEGRDSSARLALSAFRRRRSYVALLRIIPEYLEPDDLEGKTRKDALDSFLKRHEPHFVQRVEGGEYWMCRRVRDEIYEGGKRQTSSRDLLSCFLHGQAPSAKVLEALTSLARIHDDIARYCYSNLFASSHEPGALLEHIYHRISSLRYLTKLDAVLLLDPGEVIPETATTEIGKLLSLMVPEQDRSEVGVGGRGRRQQQQMELRLLRLHGVRALSRVVERDREFLLSQVSADTLIGWVEWLRGEDLGRFQIRTCLRSGLSSPKDEMRELVPVVRCLEVSSQDQTIEQAIESQCRALATKLDNLKADALRCKMDFAACIRVRTQQLSELPRDEKRSEGTISPDVSAMEGRLYALAGKRSSGVLRRLMHYLCEIWLCWRGLGDEARSAELERIAGRVFSLARERFAANPDEEIARDLESITLRWLRNLADHQLIAATPWNNRRAGIRKREEMQARFRKAADVCDDALRTVEWSAGEEFARYRSYFFSLKGRAQYLWGRYDEAHQSLDLSQAGLSREAGADRESLAVSLLRLAECLMVRSDDVIEEFRGQCTEDGDEEEFKIKLTRARRRLTRAEDVMDRAEEMLVGARQNMEWWACLYQLRAQLQVERLLLQITEPNPPLEIQRERRRFNGRLTHSVKSGLNAIRQGFDVLLPGGHDESRRDFRVDRFLRLWIELQACGAYLSRVSRKEKSDSDEIEKSLWERWVWLNKVAGLEALINPDSVSNLFWVLDAGARRGMDYRTGLAARHKILDHIQMLIEEGGLAQLWQALQGSGLR